MNGTLVSRARTMLTPQRWRSDEGLTPAEYAVGTVAVAGLGGVLIKLLTSEEVRDLIWSSPRQRASPPRSAQLP